MSYSYDYQETTYKSIIPEDQVYYSYDLMEKRLPGKLYESSLISSIDKTLDVKKQIKMQKYCSQRVQNITVLSLNVGEGITGKKEKMLTDLSGQLASNPRIKASMIEELLVRSDADFICLQNVSREIYSQWL